MAQVTKPIALDESFNTTEQTSRNIADVLAEEIGNLVSVVSRIAPQTVYDLDDLGDVDITSPSNGQVLKYNGTSQKWENGTGGGSGDSVSWTQIQQSGTKIAEIEINGVTTDVYAPTGGGGFSALIVITAATGQTVTVSKGSDTYTAVETSSGTYEVSVDSMGTWTVTDGTNTDTVAVSQQTTYYVTLSSVPDGKTVLPTDDVSIWLACGQRSETYTTLSQVLADSTCLSALISDNNATDYLVRSTTWASGITADSSAMSYIGLNNYASNTLLADTTWREAICNSEYFESVLNVKVPIMTSNTTPEGEVIYSHQYAHSGNIYDAWRAFGSDDTRYWNNYTQSPLLPAYLGYKFTSSVGIWKTVITQSPNLSRAVKAFKVQGSHDNSTWVDLTDTLENVQNSSNSYEFVNTTNYQYYRIYITSNWGDTDEIEVNKLQFYGRADI